MKSNPSTRLNKAVSILFGCSRRDADEYIKLGLIKLNGKIVDNLSTYVSKNDSVSFDGENKKLLDVPRDSKLWIYYKPQGLITTHKDEKGRKTVFSDIREKIKERVVSVGRLDINSEGLLLITTDGEFQKFAESPQTGWKRVYHVRVFGDINDEKINIIKKGVEIEGIQYGPMSIKNITKKNKDGIMSKNVWLECSIREGKNREIRRIFSHFGIQVNRLIRKQYGPYKIGILQPGDIQEVPFPKNM